MTDSTFSVDPSDGYKNRNAEAATQSAASGAPLDLSLAGLQGLIAATQRYSAEEEGKTPKVIQRLGEDFAFIRWQDMRSPIKFLRQMAGNPPVRLGVEGFRPDLVDDENPARHYIAFVVMGYRLPYPLALVVLYLWEVVGFVRYGGVWSKEDMQSGSFGVRHGHAVRRQGIKVLPGLMAADLAVKASSQPNPSGESSSQV